MADQEDPATTRTASDANEPRSGPALAGSRLAEGDVFAERYQVLRLVGRGGMGSVYAVRDTLVDETVALKTLEAGGSRTEASIERFRREVRLARRITSPHVARTHDLGTHEGVHYLTMELVDGKSLASALATEGALSASRAARVGLGIARGLEAAHAAGVVHRDLKPDNVLLGQGGRVVVTDFGIARALADEGAGFRTGGGVVGTPLYMSPEQVAGASVDHRADLYSLGLVLYEMITGAIAFYDESPISAAVKRLSQPPPDPRASGLEVPEGLASLVLRLLSREPGDRPQHAREVAASLAVLLGSDAASRAPSLVEAATMMVPALVASPSPRSTPSMPGGKSPIAPLRLGDRALAVLPFAYRGPSDQDWLGEGVGDELIDVLSRTRGLRVLGRGATARFGEQRDARAVGGELGVDFVVDGTIQATTTRARLTARLLEVSTGVQLWSERFDSDLEDLFVVQEKLARRVAEALRVSLYGVGNAEPIAPEAIELYMRAKQALRSPAFGGDLSGVKAGLDRAIELAPHFAPAYGAHAIACIRAWFRPEGDTSARRWEEEASASIGRAKEHAPDVAETFLACALFSAQKGAYRSSVESLRRTLDIAPTLPEAHQLLGTLSLEAGRAREGLERLDLALSLEPTLTIARFEKARWQGLYGELEKADALLEELYESAASQALAGQLDVRIGAYRRDAERVRRGVRVLEAIPSVPAQGMAAFGRIFLGETDTEQLGDLAAGYASQSVSPRLLTLLHQLSAEGQGFLGNPEACAASVLRAAEAVLVDLEWIERCPLLAEARGLPDFAAARKIVRARCEDIWRA